MTAGIACQSEQSEQSEQSMVADNGETISAPSILELMRSGAEGPQVVSLPEQIAEWVGDRILRAEIAPGARITEQEVSRSFSVSRAPVREAFRILERQHLIEIHARRGAFATQLTPEDIKDLSDIRSALYALIGRRLAGIGSEQAVARLEAKLQHLTELSDRSDNLDEPLRGVSELTLAVAEETGSPRIVEILRPITLQFYRYARLYAADRRRRTQSLRLWRDAIRAMKRLDSEGAMRAMQRIVETGRGAALRALERQEVGAAAQ
jgi:DNA-binding GntR family transcriptional regulator